MPFVSWQLPRLRWLAILLLLSAFALRTLNLTYQPLWFDEGWSVWFATSDIPAMIEHTAVDIHPPFYYALLHLWITVAGTSEFALRMLSVWFGVLTVALLVRMAHVMLGRRAAWLAGMLGAVSPLQVYYAQEIRMYGLVTLLGITSTLLFWQGINGARVRADNGNKEDDRPRWLVWVAYVVVTGAAMYTEYYGVFIPLFQGIYWLAAMVGRVRSKYISPHFLLAPLISFIALIALFIPWLLFAAPKLQDYVANKVDIEHYPSLTLLDYLSRHLVAYSVGHLAPEVGWLGWATVGMVGLAILGAVSSVTDQAPREEQGVSGQDVIRNSPPATRHSPRVWFLMLYLFIPILTGYLVQLRFPFAPPRMERLLLVASPAFLLLVTQGIASLAAISHQPSVIRHSSASQDPSTLRRISEVPSAVFLGLLLLISTVSLVSFYTVARYPEQDYRPLAARINALALPADVVILVHPWQVGFLQAYLNVRVTLQQVADPAWGAGDQAQLDAALGEGKRVWLPAYQTLGRMLETAMENYLTQQALSVDTTWYETTLLSFYAPLPEMKLQPVRPADFVDGAKQQLTLIGVASSPAAVEAGWGIKPLQLQWVTALRWTAPFPHISIRLQDGQQRYWAVQDEELALDRLPESQNGPCATPAQCGYTYSKNVGLLIPAGTPPGDYRITLAVYDGTTQQALGAETVIDTVTVVAPQTPPPVAALPIQTRLSAEWADTSLLGYTLRDGTWRAGETLHLDLFFQARNPSHDGGRVFVALEDKAGNAVAGVDAQAAYPLELWRSGDLIHDQRDLTLPAGLAAGRYRLVTGFLRGDGQARGGDAVLLREISVEARPHQMTPPNPQVRQDIRFGTIARIVGYDLAQDANAKTMRLRLYWNDLSETETSYKVFVHIIPASGQAPLAQHDSPPANGDLPTTAWVKGEYVSDDHLIALRTVPPGEYRVLVGLYNPADNMRLPAFASDGTEYSNSAAELARVKISE